jgi:ABC-2 type transport system ATP-binding protein
MIEVKNLSLSIQKKQILDRITVPFQPGVYGLLGPNGAGKTTLLRCMTGIYSVPRNTIQMDGMDIVGSQSYAQALGYLPQKFGLFKRMTVTQMLGYFCELKHIPPRQQKEEICKCLDSIGLSQRAGDQIRTLSGGMIRRLGIGQAFLGNPKLVILDEPTAGLDPEERIRFKNLVSSLSREDKIVILSTHIVEDVAALCDHIVILAEGKVAAVGTGEEIAASAQGKVYRIPITQAAQLTPPYFISKQEEASIRILSSLPQPGEPQTPTIEDGYLCKVKGYE